MKPVRITGIAGGRDARAAAPTVLLSGTVVVTAVAGRISRGGGMVLLSVSSDPDRRLAARTSPSGTVSMVLDTAQLPNGPCEITVCDLRGHADTRRVRIENPISKTGYFYSRDGLPLASRTVPEIRKVDGNAPFHAGEYHTFFPVICSDTADFEINFRASRPGPFPLEIRDIRGRIVRRLSVTADNVTEQGHPSWYASTTWDGKDAAGRTAPNGDYQVRVLLSHGPAATYQSLGFVHKATAAKQQQQSGGAKGGLRFAGLAEGDTLSGDVLVQISPEAATSDHVLLLLDGEPIAAAQNAGAIQRVPFTLDTARFANGRHVLEARDFHGHSTRRSVVFQNVVSRILFEPDFDRNTGGNGTRLSHLTATLQEARPWQVSLVSEKGIAVKSFRGNGQTVLLAWDGTDDRGKQASNGRYEILLRGVGQGTGGITLGYINLYVSEE